MPQKFIGFSENAMIYNRQYVIAADQPGLLSIRDAEVAGARPTVSGNVLDALSGGVFDQDGLLVPACLQPRSDAHNAINPVQTGQRRAPSRSVPKAVFGGVAFDHFGHFLLESTSRLWALPEYRDLPWLFLTTGAETLPQYQLGFLELLGLPKDNIVPVGDVIAVEELLLPEASFTYHHHVTHAYRDTFRRALLPERTGQGRRVFLSRKNTTIALTIGERELEAALLADGWDIEFPETLSPREQALLFHEDNTILGLQGSAMHLGLFAPPGRRTVHLCRGQGYRGYYVLDDLMEADATYFDAMDQPDLPSKPITGPFLLNLDATISFLREEGLLKTGRSFALGSGVAAPSSRLQEYEAWWNYTESQIRQNHGIAHDGSAVPNVSSIDYAETAATLSPNTIDIVTHAAALALKYSAPGRAIQVLDKVDETRLTNAVDRAKLHYFLSMTHDHLGQYDRARTHAETAFTLRPEEPLYGNQLAILLYRLELYDAAQNLLLRLEHDGRATATTYHVLSLLSERGGEIDETIRLSGQASRLDPTDEGLFQRLVTLYRGAGQLEELKKAAQQFSDRVGLTLALARVLFDTEMALDNLPAAAGYAERLYVDNPADLQLRGVLLTHYQHLGFFPDLSRPKNPLRAGQLEHAIMVYNHALMMAEQGRMEDCLKASASAVTLAPDNETIVLSLASHYLRAKMPILAHILSRLMIEREGGKAAFFYVLSLSEGEIGNARGAEEAARHAFTLEPDNDVIRAHAEQFSMA